MVVCLIEKLAQKLSFFLTRATRLFDQPNQNLLSGLKLHLNLGLVLQMRQGEGEIKHAQYRILVIDVDHLGKQHFQM